MEVTILLSGSFDGKSQGEEKKVQVSQQWQEVSLDFVPPEALSAGLRATLVVPPGATVLIDEVRFRPVDE